MISRLTLAAALALSLCSGAAFAQTAAPAVAPVVPMGKTTAVTPMGTPGAPKAMKPRTAQSLECSKKADAQNVHGKPRKTFMSKCKAGKA